MDGISFKLLLSLNLKGKEFNETFAVSVTQNI